MLTLSAMTFGANDSNTPRTVISEIITPKSAEMDAALKAYLDATDYGFIAEESMKESGRFTLGRDVEGLGKANDLIVQIEVRHLEGSVRGLILVNSNSKQSLVVFPAKKENRTEPGG